MKKKTVLFLVVSIMISLTACEDNKEQDNQSESQKEHTEKHDKKEHHDRDHDHKHDANEYMHQRPVDELVKNFESDERDAYQKPEKVLEYLGNIDDKKIMDIGAGSGYFSVKLAAKGANVIAADVNEEFQEVIKKRIEEDELSNIELRKIPYDSPNLENEEVDMALIVNTYHHIKNRSEYFAKVKAGTKETGELVVIDFFKSETPVGPPTHHKIGIDQVVAELKEAGYTKFEVNVDLLPYQYIIRAQ